MKKLGILLGTFLATSLAWAAGEIYLPNLLKNATGTQGAGGFSTHRGVDMYTIGGGGMQIEDSVHVSGADGVMTLGVRNDAGTALAADGDYIPLTTDSTGSLRVNSVEQATQADNTAGLPAVLKIVGGFDGTNVQAIKTDAAGELQVDVLSVPATVSTLAEQQTQTTRLTSIRDATESIETAVNIDGLPFGGNILTVGGTDGSDAVTLKTDNLGELQIDVVSSALPTGAATLAEQQTQTTHLSNIATSTAGILADTADIEIATEGMLLDTADIEIATEALAATVKTDGTAVSATAVVIAGQDGTNAQTIKTDAAGELQIDVLSSALPAGAATLAEQQSQTALLTTIDADTSIINTEIVALNAKVNQGFGLSTVAIRTAAILGNASGVADFNAGTASAQTQRVVIATDQAAVSVTPTANTAGSFVSDTVDAATADNNSAPANAVGFILFADSDNTADLRVRLDGTNPTASVGMQLEPGRSIDFTPYTGAVRVISESGTQAYQLNWVVR